MNRRKKASGGQAIVMVTLALVAMCGMMGLAVDLGWSFFVQKIAQASADGAALAAVQEAYKLNSGGLGSLGCGVNGIVCQAAAPCPSSGNLSNGCLYASANGFSVGGEGGRQNVTIEAGVSPPAPPTVPNITNIKYWVTVRTVQTIPQLFSAVLGNSQGTVSAIATAAIAGQVLPGSFYGMNREGDCLTGEGSTAKTAFNCGVDVALSGTNGTTTCTNVDGSNSLVPAKLCAPGGILLSSTCNGSSAPGCGSGSSTAPGTNYAGQTAGNAQVWAEGGTKIRGAGDVNDPAAWLPSNSLERFSSAPGADPLRTLPQPPLVNASRPPCPVIGGTLSSGTVGPYQYYAVDGSIPPKPTGLPITIGTGTNITFDPGGTCPGGASSPTSGFQTYTFWGGLNIAGNPGTHVTFGAGQYVMAGTSSTNGAVFSAGAAGANITGANGGTAPTMFLTTDGSYGGSLTGPVQSAIITAGINLHQGFTDIKNADITLQGITSAAGALSDYEGVLLWQDRRNSNLLINPTNGDFIPGPRPGSVTDTSPQLVLESGNAALKLNGLLYQPRGAWTSLFSGGASAGTNIQLTLVTGALNCVSGCGNAAVTLKGPSVPTIIYTTALIQ
jgi:hypothetical protein